MPKSILLEGYNLTLSAGTGIATYARNLARALRDLDYQTDVLLNTRRAIDTKDPALEEIGLYDALAELPLPLPVRAGLEVRKLLGAPLGIRPTEIRPTHAVVAQARDKLNVFRQIYAVPHLVDVARFHFKRYRRSAVLKPSVTPDLFHATHPIPLRIEKCPNVVTIHDLVPLRLPHTTLDDKKYFLNMLREVTKTADHIVTVSEYSRRDIIKFLDVSPERITNTYQSTQISLRLLKKSEDEVASDLSHYFDLGFRDYFLFLGAIEPKKNLSRLIDAYALSGTKRPLVIVGAPGWQFDDDLAKIADERFVYYEFSKGKITLQRRVRHLKYLPYLQVMTLLRGARGLLFPSLYEGFGLPVLEAMIAGSPVLTSNISSLPEIAGDAAVLVDPYDIEDMAGKIRMLDLDGDLRADLIQKGYLRAQHFSDQRYHERLSGVYRRLL